MDRLFYSPNQFAREVKEANASATQINYFIDFNDIRESKDFDNYYTRPVAIKIIGANINHEEHKEIMLNLSKPVYARMKLYCDSNNDRFICLRTNCSEEKTYNSIDGDHKFYSSKVLKIPSGSSLANQLYDISEQQKEERKNIIETIEEDFTL